MTNPLERLLRRLDSDDDDDEFGSDPIFPSRMLVGSHHYGAPGSTSGYHIHQDSKQVVIEVEVPGVAAQDLKVETWYRQHFNQPNCMIQWTGQRLKQKQPITVGQEEESQQQSNPVAQFANRIHLGPQVDCDHISANLSRGILWLSVPKKKSISEENFPSTRSIPIEEMP
jgi:HSP20 family molecular chaperone IbpA